MSDPIEILRSGAEPILGRALTDEEAQSFSKYLEILVKWQRTHRLVGSDDPVWIVRELFLDSLLFGHVFPAVPSSILDLGSGAGLPGVPLRIIWPGTETVLVESRRRRASFLSTVIREIGLTNIVVRDERAEALLPELEHHFQGVVMRCAGEPKVVFPLAERFLAPGGIVVASGPPERRATEAGERRIVTVGARTRHFLLRRPQA